MLELAVYLTQFLILYLFQSQYIFGGDSPEYSTVAATWSVPHPPGYPLYALLLNLSRLALPFLNPSIRNNLLSIIPTVFTAFFINKIVFLLTKRKFVAYVSSFIYVFLFPVWLYGEVPEVFALNSLLLVLITYLIILFNREKRSVYKYAIFFLIGLSISHHHTFILFIPGWYFLIEKKAYFLKKDFIFNIFFMLLGFSFYLYAPIASSYHVPIDWENAKTLDGFIRLLTRSSYGTFKAYTGSYPNLLNQLFNSFSIFIFIIQDFRIIGMVFIVAGLVALRKIYSSFFRFVMVSLMMEFIFLFYGNFPLNSPFALATYERFLIAVYLILIFPLSIGIKVILDSGTVFIHKFICNHFLRLFTKGMLIFFFIGYTLILFYSNYQTIKFLPAMNDFEIYAKNILDTAPKNSILAMRSDIGFFSTSYLYYVKNYRNDLKFIFPDMLNRQYYREKVRKAYPDVIIPENSENKDEFMNVFLKENSKKSIILFEQPPVTYSWTPYGMLWKYYTSEDEVVKNIPKIIEINDTLWNHTYKYPYVFSKAPKILFLQSSKLNYARMLESYADFLIIHNYDEKALSYLNIIFKEMDPTSVYSMKLLLLGYSRQGKCNEAKKIFEQFMRKTRLESADDYGILLKYYYFCDKENKNVEEYLRLYNNKREEERLPLKKI